MAEQDDNSIIPPVIPPAEDTPPEIQLEDVVGLPPTDLSEDQTKFLKENADNLTDEQKETFKEVLIEKEEKIDPEKFEPEIRAPKKEKKLDPKDQDDDEEIDPDDEKTIGKVVKKALDPVNEVLKEVQVLKDQTEIDGFIRENPEFNKYRGVALKYLAHPDYSNIPVKNIMAIVSANDMQKLGAQKERDAANKSKDTKGGNGNQTRPQGGDSKVDWKNLSKVDFEAEKARVLQGARQ